MSELSIIVAVPVCVAAVVSGLIVWRRPSWSRWRTIWIAALPLPTAGGLLCVAIYVNAASASKERCGVDACGMAMIFAAILLGCAIMAAAIGAVVAAVVKRVFTPR